MPAKLLRLNLNCNQRCLFCNTLGRRVQLDDIHSVKAGLQALRKNPEFKLVLTGGEPTLIPNLCELLGALRKSLPTDTLLGIQTNALRCSDADYVQKLVAAGLNYAFVPFHHFQEKQFDRITRHRSSFLHVVKGIKNLMQYNVLIEFNIVIHTYNYKALVGTVRFLENNFRFGSISFSYVQPYGLAQRNYKIVPRYSRVKEYVARAYDYCLSERIVFDNPNCGLPLCMIKGYEKFSADFIASKGRDLVPQAEKAKPEKCFKCKKNRRCFGVWKNYLAMYGDDELEPY